MSIDNNNFIDSNYRISYKAIHNYIIQLNESENCCPEYAALSFEEWKNKTKIIAECSFCDGEICSPSSLIIHIKISGYAWHGVYGLSADKYGIYRKLITTYKPINDGDKLFDIELLENHFCNKPLYVIDKFSQTTTLKWESLGIRKLYNRFNEKLLQGYVCLASANKKCIFFTLNNISGTDYIILNLHKESSKLKKDDVFKILLESGTVISLPIKENPYYTFSSSELLLGKRFETKIPIAQSDLLKMRDERICDWKLICQTGGEVVGILDSFEGYEFLSNKYLINTLVSDYLTEVAKLDVYSPLESNSIDEMNQKCSVYLMVDTVNSFYKIGISNKPSYRERTLQSEKPTIEIVTSKQYPTRGIAENIEKALHKTYFAKNIRGEWFNLNEKDVSDIIVTLS
ncbi:MAG: GIY-YIG nuclease family protein [Marinifilaceae bacterium]